MLRTLKQIEDYVIEATDGPVGHIQDCYFDDEAWTLRYLVAETGRWLSSRTALISPIAVNNLDWEIHKVYVILDREHIEKSPDINISKPISRQDEEILLDYYNYPYYWGGIGLWGMSMYPTFQRDPNPEPHDWGNIMARTEIVHNEDNDPHLRSAASLLSYRIHTSDGFIGHVDDLIFDEECWALRYFIVNTGGWMADQLLLIATSWITHVDWNERIIHIGLHRDAIRKAPLYESDKVLTRETEEMLHNHYGVSGYWPNEDSEEEIESYCKPSTIKRFSH
ncbi:hypothetical protein WH50_22655 [Pokkaliibacter plantistimulans]|uniref:Photosystem reaction center subunit H n=1 Tax=Pokkaliibacter plantistimulans TaxID=1635171 RepID=A0ABX5LR25_9GAMM|nr:PRC-barrel domain-containing protein [Pokkaliibacter plantistimulans]PXF29119.1 hypothetical protein WH50_22655 [Pokkaliibacter plantistimulans]